MKIGAWGNRNFLTGVNKFTIRHVPTGISQVTAVSFCKIEPTDFVYSKFLGRNVKDSLRRRVVKVFRVDVVRSNRRLVTLVTS